MVTCLKASRKHDFFFILIVSDKTIHRAFRTQINKTHGKKIHFHSLPKLHTLGFMDFDIHGSTLIQTLANTLNNHTHPSKKVTQHDFKDIV